MLSTSFFLFFSISAVLLYLFYYICFVCPFWPFFVHFSLLFCLSVSFFSLVQTHKIATHAAHTRRIHCVHYNDSALFSTNSLTSASPVSAKKRNAYSNNNKLNFLRCCSFSHFCLHMTMTTYSLKCD